MKNIYHLSKEVLTQEVEAIGEKKFRAEQIWKWLYQKGVSSFQEMTDISKETRVKLSNHFFIQKPIIARNHASIDGTIKFLAQFEDKKEVEVVFIPDKNRGTLCISSQVGCTLACKFCHTGTQLFVRNLEFHEIVGQVILARDLINDWNQDKKLITNIVFMGMGEPFFNYDNVAAATKILNDDKGLAISNRKTTISTSGLVPEIIKAANELKTNLAISLHAANDEVRTDIMAINKKYPLDDLLKACQIYNKSNHGHKITFEYIMLNEINDSTSDALQLANLIKRYNLNCKVNLIPFNKWDGCDYNKSNSNKITQFHKILNDKDIICTIRKTRGDDVMAACGQLKSLSERHRKVK